MGKKAKNSQYLYIRQGLLDGWWTEANGRTDGWMCGQMNGFVDRDQWTNGWVCRQTIG